MVQQPHPRSIMYQAELDPGFGRQIAAMPGGEKVFDCIQCGACSGTCPMSIYMDYSPRRIIAMICAGMKKDALRSQTVWLCASCYSCSVICPRQIKITDLMYALKQRAIQEGAYPKRFPISVLAREFFQTVQRDGRTSEGRLITRVYLRTHPWRLLKQASLGYRLWRRGRMSMHRESIRNRGELQTLLRSVG